MMFHGFEILGIKRFDNGEVALIMPMMYGYKLTISESEEDAKYGYYQGY